MKDQYFGDINDYRKYGLLRGLIGSGKRRLTVCWMLTPDDGSHDGRRLAYLDAPQTWRRYDPDLYDHLREAVSARGARDVGEIETSELLPGANYYRALVPRQPAARAGYITDLLAQSAGSDLVFFDPDNGLAAKSVRLGMAGSERYLYWEEATATFRAGSSLLIYQHFARVRRTPFIEGLARRLMGECAAHKVFAVRTAHVVFLLVPHPGTEADWQKHLAATIARWDDQFQASEHVPM